MTKTQADRASNSTMIRRGPGWFFLRALMLASVLLILAIGAGAWRLTQGPLSVVWLLPWLEQGMSDAATGKSVRLADARLAWDREDQELALEIFDLTLSAANEAALVHLPMARIRLGAGALLRGKLAPSALLVHGLTIDLRREADGALRIKPVDDAAVLTDWQTLLAEGVTATRGLLAFLQKVAVHRATIRLDDRMTGRLWRAERIDLVVQRAGAELKLAVTLDLDLDGQASRIESDLVWHIAPPTTSLPVGGRIDARFEARDLHPASLVDLLPEHRAALAAVDLPIAAKGNAAIDLALGIERVFVQLSARDGKLIDPRLAGGMLPVAALEGELSWSRQDGGQIDLSGLTVRLETGETVSASAKIQQATAATTIAGELRLANISVDRLASLWPQELAPNPRRWIVANLSLGRVVEAQMAFDLVRDNFDAPFDARKIDGFIDFADVRATYFGKLPPAEKINGRAQFDNTRMDIKIFSADVRGMKIGQGGLIITGLDQDAQSIAIDLDVSGPVSDALSILDQPPLGYMKQLKIVPRSVGGKMTAKMHFDFPLEQKLRLNDVKINATAKVTAGKLPKIVRDYDLSDASLAFALTAKGLEMTGSGRVANIPAKLSWVESFEDQAKFHRRFEMAATVNDEDRRRIDLSFEPYLTGPVAVDAVYTEYASHAEITGRAMLERSAVSIKELGWSKPPGIAGYGQFQLTLKRGEAHTLDSLHLETAAPEPGRSPLKAVIAGRFNDGALSQIKIDSFHIAPTDLTGEVTFRPQGGWDADLQGTAIDVSAFLADWRKNDKALEARSRRPPFSLRSQFRQAVLGEGRLMERVRLDLRHDGLRPVSLDLGGRVTMGDKSADLTVALSPSANGRTLEARSDNAGVALAAMNLSDYIVGGRANLSGRYVDRLDGDRLTGEIVMTDYRIVGMPVLAQLLAFASIAGIPEMLTGEGVAFHSLKAGFTHDDRALEIVEGRAAGLALGINVRGRIRQPGMIADLFGTVVPVYALNQMLAGIPLLGDILTGGKGGGIFAWNYRVTGPLDKPDVSVNPLSVLAPGFLRNLFDDVAPNSPK